MQRLPRRVGRGAGAAGLRTRRVRLLRSLRDYGSVDAVVISHLHADHVLDLVPYASALTYAPRSSPSRSAGTRKPSPALPVLHVPTGAGDVFRRVPSGRHARRSRRDRVRSARVRARRGARPSAPCACVSGTCRTSRPRTRSIFAAGGARLTYGADSRRARCCARFARDTDLLLIEATLPRPERDGRAVTSRPARPASTAARRRPPARGHAPLGRARRRVGTRRGRAGVRRPVELAHEGAVYEV